MVTARATKAVVSAATSNVDWADDTSSSAVDAVKARVSIGARSRRFGVLKLLPVCKRITLDRFGDILIVRKGQLPVSTREKTDTT